MKRSREDNTVSVIQRAVKHYRISVTKSSVKEELKSHPYYPTFRSICDVLSGWKIENYPLKYDKNEIKDLHPPYITHLQDGVGSQIAFVTGYENSKVIMFDSYNTRKRIEWNEYIKKFSGAIILINPNENSGERNYNQKWQEEFLNKYIIPVTVGIVGIMLLFQILNTIVTSVLPLQQYILLFTKLTGIFFSALLLLKEYEVKIPLAEKLCHISKSINCNSILNDKAAIIFAKVGWAEVGMIYFTASLFILFQTNFPNGFLAIASALSLPYTFYSIWYQGFKLKKWCPFCIMVQLILVTEFTIQISSGPKAAFTFNMFVTSALTFLILSAIQILLNLFVRNNISSEHTLDKLQKFKKNPEVLQALLFNQKHYGIKIDHNSLLFGKMNPVFHITAFLSLHCSHCASAFVKLTDLLKSDNNVQINIVLIGDESKFIDTLYFLLNSGKSDAALNLLDQWYKSDYLSRAMFITDYCLVEADDISHEVSSGNYELMKYYEVIGTPSFFINGYRLPSQYDLDDLNYFSDKLIKTEILT